jgi:hypothetical protein
LASAEAEAISVSRTLGAKRYDQVGAPSIINHVRPTVQFVDYMANPFFVYEIRGGPQAGDKFALKMIEVGRVCRHDPCKLKFQYITIRHSIFS